MRSVLIGTVGSTAAALKAMLEANHPPQLVVTLPRTHQSRHSDYVDIQGLAAANEIRVYESRDVNSAATLETVRRESPEFLFVIGWSQIVRPALMDVPATGAIGYHPTALPLDRGRAAIPWTILLERKHTASTLFWLGDEADNGDIIDQEFFSVAANESATTLYAKHVSAIRRLVLRTTARLACGERPRTPQNHAAATWCARRGPEDGLIDWTAAAADVERLIRAVTRPYPGAFTFRQAHRIVIWTADVVPSSPIAALPGQVVSLEEGVRVRCGDGRELLLRDVTDHEGGAVSFKLHEKLGLSLVDLWQRAIGA